jgi:hypothetical protein
MIGDIPVSEAAELCIDIDHASTGKASLVLQTEDILKTALVLSYSDLGSSISKESGEERL